MKYSLSFYGASGAGEGKKKPASPQNERIWAVIFFGLFCVAAVGELEEPTKGASNFNLFLDSTHCLVLEGVCILFQLTSRFAFNSESNSFSPSSGWMKVFTRVFTLMNLSIHLWLEWPSHLPCFSHVWPAPVLVSMFGLHNAQLSQLTDVRRWNFVDALQFDGLPAAAD